MKFKLEDSLNICGTFNVGNLNFSFDDLVDTFGYPNCGPSGDDKTQVEWHIEFEDGTVATIYDYKSGYSVEDITFWSVGGRSRTAYERVQEVLRRHG